MSKLQQEIDKLLIQKKDIEDRIYDITEALEATGVLILHRIFEEANDNCEEFINNYCTVNRVIVTEFSYLVLNELEAKLKRIIAMIDLLTKIDKKIKENKHD